jgi:hypothetical protein
MILADLCSIEEKGVLSVKDFSEYHQHFPVHERSAFIGIGTFVNISQARQWYTSNYKVIHPK